MSKPEPREVKVWIKTDLPPKELAGQLAREGHVVMRVRGKDGTLTFGS